MSDEHPAASPSGAPPRRLMRVRAWWRTRSAWTRRLAIAMAILLILQPIVGFFVVPLVVRSIVVPRIAGALEGDLRVDRVSFNPYTWRLGLEGLLLVDPDGRDAAGAARVDVDFNPLSSLVLPGWRFNEIVLDAPFVEARYAPKVGLNLARVFGPATEGEATEFSLHVPRFVIGTIDVRAAKGSFEDGSFEPPIVAAFADLSARISALDTSTGFDDINALVVTLDEDARIEWAGALSLDPPSSHGTLVLDRIGLDRYGGHAVRFTDLAVREGRLSAVLSYRFEPIATPPILRLTLGSATIDGFAADRDGGEFVALPILELGRSEVDAVARSASISRLAIEGGSLLLDRDSAGTFNLARMIRTQSGDVIARPSGDRAARVDLASVKSPAQQLVTSLSYIIEDLAGDWSVILTDLSVRKQSIDFLDRSLPLPVRAEVRDLDLAAGPISSESGFVLPYSLSARVNDATSSAEGTFAVTTRTLDTAVATDSIGLAAFGPYLRLVAVEPFASTDVSGGAATLRGHLRFETPQPSIIDWAWKGDVRLDGLALELATDRSEVLRSTRFDIAGDLVSAVRLSGEKPGATGRWKGRFVGAGAELGPPLVAAMGLGSGEVSAGDLDLDGSVEMDLPLGGDALATFEGTVATRAMSGAGLAVDGGLSARGESASIAATATLRLAASGGATAEWTGSIDATEFHANLDGARPVTAELGAISVEGGGRLGLSRDAALRLEWDGDAMVAGLRSRAAADGLEGALADARLAGQVSLARDAESPLALGFRGKGSVGAADFARATAESRLAASESSLTFEGSAEARLEGDGALRLAVDGSVDLAEPRGSIAGETPGFAAADSVVLRGKAEATLRDALREAMVDGTVALRGYRAADGDETNLGNEARGDALALEGRATATGEGPTIRVVWTGAATSEGGAVELRAVSDPATISYRRAAADGTLELDAATGRVAIGWSGSQEVRDLAAALNASMSSAEMRRVGGTGDVKAALEGERIAATWSGTIEAEAIVLREPSIDARAESAGATIDGAATVEREGVGEAALSFDGSATLAESAATLRGGPDRAQVAGRALDFRGHLGLVNRGGEPTATLRGDLRVDAPSTIVGDPPRTSVEIALVEASSLDLDQGDRRIGADRLLLRGAGIEQRMSPGAPTPEGGVDPAPAPTLKELIDALPFAVRIGELRVEESSLALIAPPGEEPERFEIDQVTLGARGIASDGSGESAIELAGRVGGSGRLGASGTFDPFRTPMLADLVITIDDALLAPANSVSARVVGWRLAAGRLTTRIPTVMRDGRVQGELRFTLDGVELAERSRHPGAPDLPLDFALAVLKDSKGQVKGTIPFSGDLSDPRFSLGGLIAEVIFGFIGKIATAPFQLLLSAFAGGEDIDVSRIPFAPGSATLDSEALKRIDLLVRALRDRPGLRVGVQGHVAAESDGRAVRLALLRDVVAERARKGFPSRTNVDDAHYRKLVGELWRETPEGQAARQARRTASFEEMENVLLAAMPLTEALLADLAARRADAVAAALRGAGVAESQFVVEAAPADAFLQPEPTATIDLELGG